MQGPEVVAVGPREVINVFAELRWLVLVVLSLLCCFGLTFLFVKGTSPRKSLIDATCFHWGESLLAGGLAVWLWRSLLCNPVLLFVPVVLFLSLCLYGRDSRGSPPS